MKEIIYIQAGSLANYTGTHFWNTQEGYFTYGSEEDESADDPIVSNDISFREGYKNGPILCPRLLVFDRKVNFGTLSQQNALQGDGSEDADDPVSLWAGNVDEYKQAPIQQSIYHSQLEHEVDEDAEPDHGEGGEQEVRYWSDFNRLYYTPRSIQRLPDTADWENVEGDWIGGQETFQRFNDDTDLMEDSLRLFVEECDSLQGLQLIQDTTTFGSFIDSFLTSFREGFSKISVLNFSFLADCTPSRIQADDIRRRRKALNDALFLRSMDGLGVFSVPIQSPSSWPVPLIGEYRINNIYHASGLLSTQIESITLPLRLRGAQESLSSFISQLNWCGTTHCAELSGLLPSGETGRRSGTDLFDPRMFQFSTLYPLENTAVVDFTRRDVSRGLFLPTAIAYEAWSDQQGLRQTFLHTTHAPPYPLPTSFPHIFPSTNPNSRAQSIPLFTSLSTTPRTSKLFRAYAKFAETNMDLGDSVGLDRDEMKELVNELWRIADGYDGESSDDTEIDDVGEDGD